MLVQSPASFLGLRVEIATTFAPLTFFAPSKWVIPMKPTPMMPIRIMTRCQSLVARPKYSAAPSLARANSGCSRNYERSVPADVVDLQDVLVAQEEFAAAHDGVRPGPVGAVLGRNKATELFVAAGN